MKTIEKIRQKIEELYDGEAPKHDQQCDFSDGYFTGLSVISNFLDTLSEEPDKSLEEEARRYAIPTYMKDVDENFLDEYPYDPVAEEAFIAGSNWKGQQMLKDAVEGEAEELYNDGESQCVVSVGTYFEPGDKVYVLKAEEEDESI